jgi:hypothetical protein
LFHYFFSPFLKETFKTVKKFSFKMFENLWSKHYSLFVVVSYWFLGLCNNFAYVTMLSAAHDILDEIEKGGITNKTQVESCSKNITNKYDCNQLSTGAILLADVLPG